LTFKSLGVTGVSVLEARVLSFVGDVAGLLDLAEFRDGLFAALRAELPCDYISLNQISPDPEWVWGIVDPPIAAEYHATFTRLALQNPLAERHLRTRDGRPLRISDVTTPEQFHATDIYREFYAPLRIEHQMAFTLPSTRRYVLAIALSRQQRDFTDLERDFVALARPHLIQAYRNALEVAGLSSSPGGSLTHGPDERALQVLGLTPSQARVLSRLAIGRSGPDIAADLQIAPRTVHKHLQRIYQKLGVQNRSTAALKAWEAVSYDQGRPSGQSSDLLSRLGVRGDYA
jgi:DNA-binding CsgD family transcriptional regulator